MGQESPGHRRRDGIVRRDLAEQEAFDQDRRRQVAGDRGGLQRFSVARIVEHREAEFRMFMPGAGAVRGERHYAGRGPFVVSGFAIQVTGPDRMDRSSVHVPGFTMMVISLGMHVE